MNGWRLIAVAVVTLASAVMVVFMAALGHLLGTTPRTRRAIPGGPDGR